MSDDNSNDECLTDYKFFCFNGIPKFMYISNDASKNATTDFFDMDFNLLPIRMKDPNSKIKPPKPEAFDEMKRLAMKLAKGCPHVRVDFYYINKKIYFGELTFYHNGGFGVISPKEWNKKIGDFINTNDIC